MIRLMASIANVVDATVSASAITRSSKETTSAVLRETREASATVGIVARAAMIA